MYLVMFLTTFTNAQIFNNKTNFSLYKLVVK